MNAAAFRFRVLLCDDLEALVTMEWSGMDWWAPERSVWEVMIYDWEGVGFSIFLGWARYRLVMNMHACSRVCHGFLIL